MSERIHFRGDKWFNREDDFEHKARRLSSSENLTENDFTSTKISMDVFRSKSSYFGQWNFLHRYISEHVSYWLRTWHLFPRQIRNFKNKKPKNNIKVIRFYFKNFNWPLVAFPFLICCRNTIVVNTKYNFANKEETMIFSYSWSFYWKKQLLLRFSFRERNFSIHYRWLGNGKMKKWMTL